MTKKLLIVLLFLSLSCAVLSACTAGSDLGVSTETIAPSAEADLPANTPGPDTDAPSAATDTAAAETDAPVKQLYYVRTPKQPAEKELQTEVYTYENYDDALAHATQLDVAVLGYAVYDEEGNFLGGKYDELVTNLLYNGKHVTDYVKMKGYKYGHAGTNPAFAYKRALLGREPREKLVSCDRLVDWILYDTGFTDQPKDMGMHINGYMDPKYGIVGWCVAHNFIKIENPEDLRAGDLVFTNPKKNDPTFPGHVYLFAGECDESGNGLFYRYDGGADDRLMCNGRFEAYSEIGQPFKEEIGTFLFGYRPVESALEAPLGE